MTPEFGAASQLEKTDMLDFADVVAINKFDRRGALDALRDVRRQLQRNHESFDTPLDDLPVFGTIAARFNDDGVTALYHHLRGELRRHGLPEGGGALAPVAERVPTGVTTVVPPERSRYLADVAGAVRDYHRFTAEQAEVARRHQALRITSDLLAAAGSSAAAADVEELLAAAEDELDPVPHALLDGWPHTVEAYSGDEHVDVVRDREVRTPLTSVSLAGTHVPKVALPRFGDDGDLLRFLRDENLPGGSRSPAGLAFKRGRGPHTHVRRRGRRHPHEPPLPPARPGPAGDPAVDAFDSVTLYGFDPDERPDIYGKVGNSGVSISTLDDMRALYDGFDLCDPSTSVSMTINGPAPTILAMYFCTAIEQRMEAFRPMGRPPSPDEAAGIRAYVLRTVRACRPTS